MRYIIAFLVLYLTASICRGQEVHDFSSRRNEINVGFNKVTDFGVTTCLGYRYLFNGGALRAGTELQFSSFINEYETNSYTGYNYLLSPKIGYEFFRRYGRFKIYYGADLVYSYGRYRGEDSYVDQEFVDVRIRRYQGVSIRPLLGLSVFVFKSLSISVESFFDIGYMAFGENHPEADDPWISSVKGVSANLVPLGLFSVNYHF